MHTTREVIEIFIRDTYPHLLDGELLPKLKFIFNNDIYPILEDVKNNPFVMEDAWTPDIHDCDIEFLKENNKLNNDDYVVYVSDAKLFFDKLTELINTYEEYYIVRNNEYLYLIDHDYNILLQKDLLLVHENTNNYRIIYKDNHFMYMHDYLKNNRIILEYYDISTYQKIA